MKGKKRIPAAIAALLLLCVIGGGLYVRDYYPAEEDLLPALALSEVMEVSVTDNRTVLAPEQPNGIGFVFYPGGKVEHTAYLPLLERLSAEGVTCILLEMPLRLAVLDADAANGIFEQFPQVERWYIGGHSLGGAMASSYAAKHPDEIEGVILLGAYLYGGWPAEKALTVYGSEDLVLDRSKLTYTENVVVIEGGNHAQFGSYGIQKGDGAATISQQEQQSLTSQLILDYFTGEE